MPQVVVSEFNSIFLLKAVFNRLLSICATDLPSIIGRASYLTAFPDRC